MQNMYDMRDVVCDAYACSGKEINEQGSILANQVCHWKYEMISVEIDIKITGNGCTVCKWQAKQDWHESVINSMIALRMQQETMLQHSTIATKHTTVIYRRCLTKYEHWATAKSHNSRFKQAWQKSKRYQVHKLSENNKKSGFNVRKQCLEQENNMLQEHIMAKQGMAWNYTKHITKVPYWPWAKKDQKIWWHPCKHSKFC